MSLVWPVALLATLVVVIPSRAAEERDTPGSRPAYVQRGDEVEARYRAFRERLERDVRALGPRLQADAPDLYPKLQAATPEPIPYGYQILPRMIPDAVPSAGPPRAISTSYSWSSTDSLIDAGVRKLDALEARLDELERLSPDVRRGSWEEIVDGYIDLTKRHRLINTHIQYNRLWQKEIARDRAGYDRLTALYDAALERQAMLDEMRRQSQGLDESLRMREQTLLGEIRQHTRAVNVPRFVWIERPSARRWVVRVPVYTDIEQPSFVQAFRGAVENAWRLKEGADEFQVVLDLHDVPASQLYPAGGVPARGEHIELARHIARFPPDGAVLTTGANTTHVLGRAIVVGPHDIAPNTLAHEFGHILGFVDGYFRGYRDRGADGFEVLEVVPDPTDIMSAPGIGRVTRWHFERILEQRGAEPAGHPRNTEDGSERALDATS